MTSGSDSPPAPPELLERHRGWTWTEAWSYLPHSVTWRLESPGGEIRFLKISRLGWGVGLDAECERMSWAHRYIAVPKVIGCGSENAVEWMLTEGLPGRDATHPDLKADPRRLVGLLARALRDFHASLPVEECPFDFRNQAALDLVGRRVAEGLINVETDFHPEHEGLTPEDGLAQLKRLRPDDEDLVVCHGDYCFPNVLIEDWKIAGYLDLGELGVADRWWDVAVGAWSTTWNIGEGYEDLFYESYGIEWDSRRIAFYRLLYDLAT